MIGQITYKFAQSTSKHRGIYLNHQDLKEIAALYTRLAYQCESMAYSVKAADERFSFVKFLFYPGEDCGSPGGRLALMNAAKRLEENLGKAFPQLFMRLSRPQEPRMFSLSLVER